jgi:hypothetical protein
MRYFLGTPKQFDQMRSAVMIGLSMPNQYADEPWAEGVSSLALGSHHYEPEQYAAMVASAIKLGITEVSEAEYMAMQPTSEEI